MSIEWNYPGSKWWKFDFHVHSPASQDYGRGDEGIRGNTTEELWLRKTMQASLDCVVVADHNSGAWIDRLKQMYKQLNEANPRPEWFRPLIIFPGTEITISDSTGRVHLLAVFDPEKHDGSKVTGVLGTCGITSGHGDDKTTSTTTSFTATVKEIQNAGGIAIPAHIDGHQGLLEHASSLTPDLEKSLSCIFAAEFCDPGFYDNADPSLKKAMDRLAVLAGSDAHKPDEIGRHWSWLKMSRPSIEGLRLALIDHEFCVKNQDGDPNHVPDVFLRRLVIRSMGHCGRMPAKPFVMELHPHFNAIIGGRGTGKSTALESLRIASRRERELEETPKLKEELEKFMRPASNKGVMLNDTELLLAIHRRGKEYRLRWRYDAQGEALEEYSAAGDWVPCEPGDPRDRFPLSIFSQKQINELASNPKGLLEILDRSPQVNRMEWQQQWEITKSQFLQLRERQREITRQLAQEPQIKTRLQDVENDLKQYEEKGHGEILKDYQKRNQQLHAMPMEDSFNNLAADIREVAEGSSISDFPHHVFEEQDPTTAEVRDIHEQTGARLQTIQNALNAIALTVDELEAERRKKLEESQWYAAVLKAIESYQTLAKEYEEKHSHLDLSLYGQWVQQRGQLHQQMTKVQDLRREAEQVQDQIEEIFRRLHQLRYELLIRRNSFIASVIGDNQYVQMELVQFGDIGNIETEYRTILGLNEDGFKSSILDRDKREGLLWDLFNWEESDNSGANLPQIIHDLKEVTGKIASGGTDAVPINIHGKLAIRLQRAHEQQPANLDQLWCWWPEDLLRVKYARDPQARRFEDLEKGSAGQKAAAILAFLLSHGDEPLIMDQPEDDLDNALIYDLVVRQIHANKNRRQLVIVTHNPNIVVNGDAELVHVLKFERGQVQLHLQGGLEEESVRNAICDIMEGGREAFEKRYKRITLEV